MKKIIIYGMGPELIKVSRIINKENAAVVAYVENEGNLGQGNHLFGEAVGINLKLLKELAYDYIVIAAYNYDEITEELKRINVPENKIVQLFNYHFFFIHQIFYQDQHVTDEEIRSLFTDLAAVRMALKY